jgi:Mg2+ and Co2+ transporter CorA
VLQQLLPRLGVDVFVSNDGPGTDAVWVDASDPAASEISAVVARFDLSEEVEAWLTDADRSARVQTFDTTLVCVLDVPMLDESDGSGITGVTAVAVVLTDSNVFTLHNGGADGAIADAASSSGGQHRRPADAAVVGVVDQILERYTTVISQLGERQEAHATKVLDAANGAHSAKDVVATGLGVAMTIGDVERRLRLLRQTVGDIRGLAVSSDGGDAVAGALQVRLQKLNELDADLDSMNHRLEVTTEAQLNLLSSRQGEINKRIGAWAAVIGVDAVITGWYGMNIKGLPGADSWVTVAILMASITVALIIWFRRIDWL